MFLITASHEGKLRASWTREAWADVLSDVNSYARNHNHHDVIVEREREGGGLTREQYLDLETLL